MKGSRGRRNRWEGAHVPVFSLAESKCLLPVAESSASDELRYTQELSVPG